MPSESAAMPMRPLSSVFMKLTKPWLSSPSRFSTGTSTSSKISSAVSDARQPSLSSFLPARNPGIGTSDGSWPTPTAAVSSRSDVSFVRMNELMPARSGRGIRHRRDDEDLADAAVRDESLRAVQHVAVAAAHRGRARAAGVAARLGLGESEAAHDFARREQRHVAALLLRRAELHDRRRAERRVRGDRERVRRVDLRQLVDHDHEAQDVEPRAAELFGPRHAEQSELAHLADAFPGNLARRVVLGGDRRDLVAGELANHLAGREVLLGEVERIIHGAAFVKRLRYRRTNERRRGTVRRIARA